MKVKIEEKFIQMNRKCNILKNENIKILKNKLPIFQKNTKLALFTKKK